MSDPEHSIHVTRGDVTVEVSGNEAFVESRFEELSETYLAADAATTTTTGSDRSNLPAKKGISLSELYTTASISYKRDAALLIGYYLEQYEDKGDFTKSEIEEQALQAKVELGKNLARDLGTLIENGLLYEVGERGGERTYYLTRTGENHVETEFDIAEVINP